MPSFDDPTIAQVRAELGRLRGFRPSAPYDRISATTDPPSLDASWLWRIALQLEPEVYSFASESAELDDAAQRVIEEPDLLRVAEALAVQPTAEKDFFLLHSSPLGEHPSLSGGDVGTLASPRAGALTTPNTQRDNHARARRSRMVPGEPASRRKPTRAVTMPPITSDPTHSFPPGLGGIAAVPVVPPDPTHPLPPQPNLPPGPGDIVQECEIHLPPGNVNPQVDPVTGSITFVPTPGAHGLEPNMALYASVEQASSPNGLGIAFDPTPPPPPPTLPGAGFTGELPLCPPGFIYDYAWQSCWPQGQPRPPVPPELGPYPHACKCGPMQSYVPQRNMCWVRGSGSLPPWPKLGAQPGPPAVGPEYAECPWTYPVCESMHSGSVPLKLAFRLGCGGAKQDRITQAGYLASRIATTAEEWLDNLAAQPPTARQILWSYGALPLWEQGNIASPRTALEDSPAPSHWLGPYSDDALQHLRKVVSLAKNRLQKGWGIIKKPLRIWCGGSAVGVHFPYGHISLGSGFWSLYDSPESYGDRVGGVLGAALVLLHEALHWNALSPRIRDRKHDVCGDNKCYGPVNARKLVFDGEQSIVRRNIENFVHWMGARWVFFGLCTWWNLNLKEVSWEHGSPDLYPDGPICCTRCGAPLEKAKKWSCNPC